MTGGFDQALDTLIKSDTFINIRNISTISRSYVILVQDKDNSDTDKQDNLSKNK